MQFKKLREQKFDYRRELDTCNLGDYLNGEEKLAATLDFESFDIWTLRIQ